MGKKGDASLTMMHTLKSPIYQLEAIGTNTVVAAGGGGSSKTGVPNRIDVVEIPRSSTANCHGDGLMKVVGGVDTGQHAVMHMALSVNSNGAAVLMALEGSSCQEYLLCAKKNDSFEKSGSPDKDHLPKEQDFKVSSSAATLRSSFSPNTSSSDETFMNGEGASSSSGSRIKKRSKCKRDCVKFVQ